MKKIPVLLFFLMLTHLGFSQDWRFGISAKPMVSFFKVEKQGAAISSAENNGIRLGFAYGLQTTYKFADNYGLGIDLNHVLAGGKYTTVFNSPAPNITSITRTTSWKSLEYLELPISIKMQTNEIGYLTYYGRFGLAPMFTIKSRGDVTTVTVEPAQTGTVTQEDVKLDARLLNIAVVIGGGVMYSISGNTYLVGGVSFHNGLTNIDGDDMDNTDEFTIKNSWIALDLGVQF